MEKILILGVMVVLLTGCQNEQKLYEYYDLEGNFGISKSCKSNNDDLICKTNSGYVKVSQYSEINEK